MPVMTPSSIIPAARHAERRHQGAAGSQAPLPWQLPQNVSDSDDPAAAESAPNADSAWLWDSSTWMKTACRSTSYARQQPPGLFCLSRQPGNDRRVGELVEERQEQTGARQHHDQATAVRYRNRGLAIQRGSGCC